MGFGTDQGVYLSTDAGISWRQASGIPPDIAVDGFLPVQGRDDRGRSDRRMSRAPG